MDTVPVMSMDDEPMVPDASVYVGISSTALDDAQRAVLLEPPTDQELEIRPDGIVYLSHVGYRRRLTAAVGPMGWAMRRLTGYWRMPGALLCEFALYVNGSFVSAAIGEGRYDPDDDWSPSFSDASESCRSNALVRCCKDLGMALELWDKSVLETWRNTYAVQVTVQKRDKQVQQWRLKSGPPLPREVQRAQLTEQQKRALAPAVQAPVRPAPAPVPVAQERAAASVPAQGSATAQRQQRAFQRDDTTITPKQVRMLWTVVSERGIDQEMVAAKLKTELGVESSKQIRASQFQGILKWIEAGADAAQPFQQV